MNGVLVMLGRWHVPWLLTRGWSADQVAAALDQVGALSGSADCDHYAGYMGERSNR